MTTTIVTRSGKGSPLTNTELDANFTNLKATADGAISSTGNNTLSGNLIVTGDLEVQGTTTSIDSTTVEITDLNITLAKDATNSTQANGAGITIAGSGAELKYVSTGDKWTLNKNLDVSGTIQDSNGTFLSSSSVSTFGGTLIDDADAAAARTTLGLGTAATSATGDFLSSTGNISLGDNVKLQLGNQTDGDLQIYHDGSNSYIAETGTGGLIIKAGSALYLRNPSDQDMILAQSGGAVTLYHNNSAKIATTSTGIDVTGSAKVTGSASANTSAITMGFTAPDGQIKVKNSTGSPASNLDFYTTNSSGATTVKLGILANGGLSISTGNVTMDGTLIGVSALGMGGAITGATSVQTDSIIEKTAANGVSIDGVILKDGNVTAGGLKIDGGTLSHASSNASSITISGGSNSTNGMNISLGGSSGSLSQACVWKQNSSEKMRLNSTGLGVGTSSPSKLLHLAESADGTKLRITRGGVCEWDFSIGNTSTLSGVGSGALEILPQNSGTANELAIGTAGSTTALVHVTTSGTTFSGSVTAASYVTSSDARLKDNIKDAKDSGEIIDKIKVRQFDWKKTGKHQDYGMIAQELILECPDAVLTPTEDHKMMGVDYTKLIPLMMKEIQNLRKEIKLLKEKEK